MILIKKIISKEAQNAILVFCQKEGKEAHFKNFKRSDGKNHVQESLIAEQFYICAYCMKRIDVTEKIEHWHTQEASKKSESPRETMQYKNMLAVCKGISYHENQEYEHCDQSRSKSNRVLTIHPTNKTTIAQIKYLKNGKIYSENEAIMEDLDGENALNLNALKLMDSRKNVYDSVKKLIDIKCKGKSESEAKQEIRKIVESWKNPSYNKTQDRLELKEYCGIVLYFFEKYLK